MADDDFDLKEALVRSLRENGILPKIQAQLKAAVYLALEKHNYAEGLPPANQRVRTMLSSEDGLIIASLLADFLTQMDLSNTINVLKHELQMDQLSLLDRGSLCSMLGLHCSIDDVPIITTLLKTYKSSRNVEISSHGSGSHLSPENINNTSHPPVESNRIPNGSTSKSVSECNNPTNDSSYANTKASHNCNESHGELGNSIASSTGRIYNATAAIPANVPKTDQTVRIDPTSISSPMRSGSNTSPRDQDYGDDFNSPRSQESPGSLSTVSRSGDVNKQEKSMTSKNNVDSRVTPSFLVDMRTNQVVRIDGTSSPLSGISESSFNCNEKLLISRSGTNSPSVIRVYAPTKRRTPSNEASSDVDDDDDVEDIPESLRREDSESDTIDQTVDSEQSLKLDYMEDIQSPRHSITPTPAL